MRRIKGVAGLAIFAAFVSPLLDSLPASAADTIVLGAAISMTGKTAKEGEYTRDGYQFAVFPVIEMAAPSTIVSAADAGSESRRGDAKAAKIASPATPGMLLIRLLLMAACPHPRGAGYSTFYSTEARAFPKQVWN